MSRARMEGEEQGAEGRKMASGWKRATFLGVILLLTTAFLELASFLALWSQGKGMPSASLWRQERAAAAGPSGTEGQKASSARPPTGGGQVIHPFVGFVQDLDVREND